MSHLNEKSFNSFDSSIFRKAKEDTNSVVNQETQAEQDSEKLKDCEFWIRILSMSFYAREENELKSFVKFKPKDKLKWADFIGESASLNDDVPFTGLRSILSQLQTFLRVNYGNEK